MIARSGSRLAVLALLTMLFTGRAGAVCQFNSLSPSIAQSTFNTPVLLQINQTNPYWSAVAVRSTVANEDWDLNMYSGTAPDPTCVTGLLANSIRGPGSIDFVIGDFNHNTVGNYYAAANRLNGSGASYVEWDSGPDLLTVNGTSITQALSGTDFIRVYDVQLTAGQTYNFDFYATPGSGYQVLLFRNTTGGTYWVGRNSNVFSAGGPTTYLAPSSGYYGVVVVNDGGIDGSYHLGVTTSACGIPTALVGNTPVTVAPTTAHFSLNPQNVFWEAYATRPVSGSWDAYLYGSPTGGAVPVCFGNNLGGSILGTGFVNAVVTDYNNTPLDWEFPYAEQSSGAGSVTAEYLQTKGVFFTNTAVRTFAMSGPELGHIYDVQLLAGKHYKLHFVPSIPGMRAALFANVGQGPYHAGRVAAAAAWTTGEVDYVAPYTGYYGLMVFNDGAVSANYDLAVGNCAPATALVTDVASAPATQQNQYFSFDQSNAFWAAAAVRGQLQTWGLSVAADSNSAWPVCSAALLANSNLAAPKVNVVVGDFNFNPVAREYVHAYQSTGLASGEQATVQWSGDHVVMSANDVFDVTGSLGTNDLVRSFDVFLNSGQSYTFTLQHPGTADLHMLVFHNAGGPYWTNRAGAVLDVTTTGTYVAPNSGFYGVVLVDDNATSDTYAMHVRSCEPVTVLPSTPASVQQFNAMNFNSFSQAAPYWAGVATRAIFDGNDFDLDVYSSGTGGALGTCFSGQLANSTYLAGTTDLVMGDFNFNPLGTYYERSYRYSGISGCYATSVVGSQQLLVGAGPVLRTVASSYLAESWDVHLQAGVTYGVLLNHPDSLHVNALVFKPTGGVNWVGRSAAFASTAKAVAFTAPVTGWYGVVVANDGGSGKYNLQINSGTLGVDNGPVIAADAFRGIAPNPGRGQLSFEYALHDGGDVRFDVIDMAGRLVSRIEPGHRDTGEWSERWTAADAQGHPLAPGLYFVRMRRGEQVIGQRKLTILE